MAAKKKAQSNWIKVEDQKPPIGQSVLMATDDYVAEGEYRGGHWMQYRWSARLFNQVRYWQPLPEVPKGE